MTSSQPLEIAGRGRESAEKQTDLRRPPLIGRRLSGRGHGSSCSSSAAHSVTSGQARSLATVLHYIRCLRPLNSFFHLLSSRHPSKQYPQVYKSLLQMSLSDFWVHRLISTTTPSPVPSCSSASSEETLRKTPEAPPLLKPEAMKPLNFSALQMLQMQMIWQPHLIQNFMAMIQMEQEQQKLHQHRIKVSLEHFYVETGKMCAS